MHILFIGLDPKIGGGVPSYTGSLLEELDKRGHQLSFLHQSGYPMVFREIEDLPQYRKITLVNSSSYSHNFDDPLRDCRNRGAETAVYETIIESKPDIVHFQHLMGLSGSILAPCKKNNLPTVFTLHDYWLLCPLVRLQRPSGKLCPGPDGGRNCIDCCEAESGTRTEQWLARYEYLKKSISENIDIIVAVSNFVKKIFASNGYPEEKIEVLSSTNENIEKIWEEKTDKKNSSGPLTIGCISNIFPSKGVSVLVDAVNLLNEDDLKRISVEIYGKVHDEIYYEKMVSKIKGASLPINFNGEYDQEALPGILSGIDLGVVPSAWYEPRGMVALELLAARIPVLGSRIGGIAETIKDGENGFLFEPSDPSDLRKKIEMFIGDRGLVEKIGQKIEKPLTMKTHVDDIEKIYEELLRKPKLKPATNRNGVPENKVSIVILTHNKLELTKKCLEELLFDRNGHQIVVVDNASNDGTVDHLKKLEDGESLVLIANEKNLGFAAGCNQGVRAAKNDFIILLNNDVVPMAGWMDYLLEAWDEDVGAVGAKLFFPDGSIQHAGVLFNEYMKPRHRFYKLHPDLVMDFESPVDFTSVTAACMLTSKDRWQEVGGLDESFKIGSFEDVDFCLKLREKGYRIVYQPRANLIHHEHASSKDNLGRHKYWKQNLELFRSRWEKRAGEHVFPKTRPFSSLIFVSSDKKEIDKKSLRLIKERTTQPFEIFLIVKDAHLGDTFKKKFQSAKVIEAENQIEGINLALKKSLGKFVSIVYGGQLVPPNWISKSIEFFSNNKIGMVAIAEEGMNFKEVTEGNFLFEADYDWKQSRSILTMPRDPIVERIGLFGTTEDVEGIEDVEYQLRIIFGGLMVAFLKDIKYKKIANFERKVKTTDLHAKMKRIWEEYKSGQRKYF